MLASGQQPWHAGQLTPSLGKGPDSNTRPVVAHVHDVTQSTADVPVADRDSCAKADHACLPRKVYVSAEKREVSACQDLPTEHACLLTTDESATDIQAVPLRECSQQVSDTARCVWS